MAAKNILHKITIGLPSTGLIRIETAVSLAALVSTTKNMQFYLDTPTTCYIHQNREDIVTKALRMKSDYILFIDSDMAFPPDGLTRLLEHKVDIIGANYNQRSIPIKSVVKLDPECVAEGEVTYVKQSDGIVTASFENNNEPFKCRAVGAGFLLINTKVFKKIPQPWFFFRPSSHPKGMIGEDVWFCDRAREQGYDIWCDPTIQINHIGIGIY